MKFKFLCRLIGHDPSIVESYKQPHYRHSSLEERVIKTQCDRCGNERSWIGSSTVWNDKDTGARAGTSYEMWFCNYSKHQGRKDAVLAEAARKEYEKANSWEALLDDDDAKRAAKREANRHANP
jgi:hypothetical protein